MVTTRYFYLAPDALDAPGFAYGSSETEAGDVLEVRRLQTGRWKYMGRLFGFPSREADSKTRGQ
ncbi:hypothetical protein PI125_g22893 [Phytophthora idaei]|nr:hypothetical protein PI125_g22893 [Phytophthora idaei]